MQAVELRLPGKYWDTFLYDGRLILFTREGEIHTYDWDRLVASFQVDLSARPMFRQFLTRGRAWYAPELRQLLSSPDLKRSIEAQVRVLSADWYQADTTYLESARVARVESPAFPHTDVEAFYNTLFLSSSLGVHAISLAQDFVGASTSELTSRPCDYLRATDHSRSPRGPKACLSSSWCGRGTGTKRASPGN